MPVNLPIADDPDFAALLQFVRDRAAQNLAELRAINRDALTPEQQAEYDAAHAARGDASADR